MFNGITTGELAIRNARKTKHNRPYIIETNQLRVGLISFSKKSMIQTATRTNKLIITFGEF